MFYSCHLGMNGKQGTGGNPLVW